MRCIELANSGCHLEWGEPLPMDSPTTLTQFAVMYSMLQITEKR